LGGTVAKSPEREVGFQEIQREPAAHPAFRRWPGSLPVYQFHEDAFTLPPGCESLATSPACRHQAFARDARTLGLQFHPESTPEWIRGNAASARKHRGPYVQAPEETEAALPKLLPPMMESFFRLLDDFVAGWR
jgi:GMP synthase-like glutamine amidotransferase